MRVEVLGFVDELIGQPRGEQIKLFEEVEDGVVRRLYELYNRLKAGKPSKKKDVKLRLLEQALSRTTKRAQHTHV